MGPRQILARAIYHARISPANYLVGQGIAALPWRASKPHRQEAVPGVAARALRVDFGSVPKDRLPEAADREFFLDTYADHRFDVLGSQWASQAYGANAAGIQGHRYSMKAALPDDVSDGLWLEAILPTEHLARGRECWQQLMHLKPGYLPIDWQRDSVSGFRWDSKLPSRKQARLHRGCPGADPIRPMAFGRLLHLPRMLLLAALRPESSKDVLAEYQAQVLDFIGSNPVGYGIQWHCALDVAIRTANLVLADWLYRGMSGNAAADHTFRVRVAEAIHTHGLFLRDNLEFNVGNTGNHYLGGLVGLMFAASYFEATPEVFEWEGHVLDALPRELRRQFYADGGHFEGSTGYHAFCSELLVWLLALSCSNRAGKTLPDSCFQTAAGALNLIEALRNPHGELPQFGDSDTARLFIMLPEGCVASRYADVEATGQRQCEKPAPGYEESRLRYTGVTDCRCSASLQWQLLEAIAGREFPSRLHSEDAGSGEATFRCVARRADPALMYHQMREFPSQENLQDDLVIRAFTDSGIYLARSRTLYLAVSAHTNPAQKRNLPHGHNDKLGVEMHFGTQPVLLDPGTYVYGALPEWRDSFRRTGAHSVPVVQEQEQNRFVDTFISYPDAEAELLEIGPSHLRLALRYRGVRHQRLIEIEPGLVRISDWCNRPFKQNWSSPDAISPAYGRLRTPL